MGKGEERERRERNERTYSGSSNHGGCLMDCSDTQEERFSYCRMDIDMIYNFDERFL